jgi:CBS domain-containing protein
MLNNVSHHVAQATFIEVLEKLVKNRIHRIYIIDANSRPVGVVTCSDIIRKIVETIVES